MTAMLALSGAALAHRDTSDHYGETPYCNDGQFSRVNNYDGPLNPYGVSACEGEHWEGGDHNADRDAAFYDHNSKVDAAAGKVLVSQDYDPSSSSAAKATGAGDLGVRASARSAATHAAYTGVAIGGLGRVTTWVEVEPSGAVHVAVFLQDYSDQLFPNGCTSEFDQYDCNILAYAVHRAGVTQGSSVAEESPDCSQNDPNSTANNYEGGTCARDNTAVTVNVALP